MSGDVDIIGGVTHGITPRLGSYNLNDGTLLAHDIIVNSGSGFGGYTQTNGVAQVRELRANGAPTYFSELTLAGGTLNCSNVSWTDGAIFHQHGGALVAGNELSFGGFRQPGPKLYSRYEFLGGTLSASNINVDGDWIIGSSFPGNRISNPGTITLSHTLQISNVVEQLGRFILATNAVIDLAGEAGKLSFADSSNQVWNLGAKLMVLNWNWLTSANTLGDQLFFGTNQFGLSAAQLQRIHFINPAGYAPGDYTARIFSNGEIQPGAPASADITNDWTGANGNWHDLTWSLGVRPDSSQTVRILGGDRTVNANAGTSSDFPASLTVHDLVLRGSPGNPSLVLSNMGGVTPFRALNGIVVADGAKLVNLNSGLIVDGAVLDVTNAQVIQDGGFMRTTNASIYVRNSTIQLTNGTFEAGYVVLALGSYGYINQYGGRAVIANLQNAQGNSLYSLFGGTLELPAGLYLYGEQGGTAYFQSGGTNWTPRVKMQDSYAGSGPSLTLNGGLLAAGEVEVMSGWFGRSTVVQNGGTHIVTNALNIIGGSTTGATVKEARYSLNNGLLSAGSITLDADLGDALFVQTNGTATAGTVFGHSHGYYGSFNTYITLTGGSLSCSDFTLDDGHGSLSQSGGVLVVSNLLTITGYRDLGISRYYGLYAFSGGTVMASNLNIVGDWSIGDGGTNRISNPGTISLAHSLEIGEATEQLGRFILATNTTNATINLAGSASQLSFANSSGESWPADALLKVVNWNGNSAGGGAEQLKFGTNEFGLTPAQLSQIRFSLTNSTNLYTAKILSTGEVVPDLVAGPSVVLVQQGSNLILNWPARWLLQAATNAPGPYVDIQGAMSPYTNDMTGSPMQFFRLRQE